MRIFRPQKNGELVKLKRYQPPSRAKVINRLMSQGYQLSYLAGRPDKELLGMFRRIRRK